MLGWRDGCLGKSGRELCYAYRKGDMFLVGAVDTEREAVSANREPHTR